MTISAQLCILCGHSAGWTSGICAACQADLPYPVQACSRCGVELGPAPPDHGFCGQCLMEPPGFDTCIALSRYEYPVRELIARFKYQGQFAEGYTLGRLLAEKVAEYYEARGKPDVLLPVPLHSSRLRERGYNQSTELARILGRHCNIPMSNKYCLRSRATPSQKGLSADERAMNLRNAFSLSEVKDTASWRHVAIVDDVVTTMTTVNSLARMLRSAGHQRIDVLCIARVSACNNAHF